MQVQSPTFTWQASAALDPYLRVSLDGNDELEAAGATTKEIGTLVDRVLAADDQAAVLPMNAAGTRKMVAAGAISVGDVVYSAAGGKIDTSSAGGEHAIGWALEAASGDGSIIEVLVDRGAA